MENIMMCYCLATEKTYKKLKEDGLEPNRRTPGITSEVKPFYYVIEDKNTIWESTMSPNSFIKIKLVNNEWMEA